MIGIQHRVQRDAILGKTWIGAMGSLYGFMQSPATRGQVSTTDREREVTENEAIWRMHQEHKAQAPCEVGILRVLPLDPFLRGCLPQYHGRLIQGLPGLVIATGAAPEIRYYTARIPAEASLLNTLCILLVCD